MKLPQQSVHVRREVVEIRYGAAASPTMKQGITPSSIGGGGNPPPPPPPPRACTYSCSYCYPGEDGLISTWCQNMYGSNYPLGRYPR